MSIKTQIINSRPRFTLYAVSRGLFSAQPLVVIDGGARGGFEDHWSLYQDQIELFGFEPNLEEYEKLSGPKKRFNHRYFPLALGRKIGKKALNIQPHVASSSMYKSNQSFVSRFAGWQPLIPNKTKVVKTVDLDSFSQKNIKKPIDFIKLDTEGAELDILMGARKTLKSVVGLSLEAVFSPWRKNMPTFSDLDIYLRQLGFFLFDLPVFRWTRKNISPLMFTDGVIGPTDKGQSIWTQAVYFRDGFNEIKSGNSSQWDDARIFKLASIMELYNFEDCAIELLEAAAEKKLIEKFELFRDLLTPPIQGKDVTYQEYVEHIRKSGPYNWKK